MTIDDNIRDEKLQYSINRKAPKISALLSGKIDKYEYLTSEKIILSDKRRAIEQTKLTYYPLSKAFEKQTKATEDQAEKQIKALEEHGEKLAQSNLLLKKKVYHLIRNKKVYHLISTKKYSIDLLQKERKK